jgi:hypothetical protein
MSLDNLIKQTQQLQDLELASAIKELKNRPGDLQSFLQNQQDGVYKNITTQKDNTFQKVYGDLKQSQHAQESILLYNKRSRELAKLHDNIYENQKHQADAIVENKNTFGRKYEMNEWSVGNKKDTLFFVSALFVALSILILFTYLLRQNLISGSVWGFTCSVVIIILVLILINRAQYTNILRNKQYWNKRNFAGKYGIPPTPVCPTDVLSSTANNMKNNI